jgi:hypothetical protein
LPNSVQVDGVPRLLRTLEGLTAKARDGASKRVTVGYAAPYSDVLPDDPLDYTKNGLMACMKFLGKGRAPTSGTIALVSPSDFPDVVRSQRGKMLSLSPHLTAFAITISRIFRRRSEKQVSRIDAGTIVATMENTKAIGDWSIVKFPGIAVRFEALASNGDMAIPATNFTSRPYPARSEGWMNNPVLVYPFPEAMCGRRYGGGRSGAVALPAVVVHCAPAASGVKATATFDRAKHCRYPLRIALDKEMRQAGRVPALRMYGPSRTSIVGKCHAQCH